MKLFFESIWAVFALFIVAVIVNTVLHVPALGFQRGYAFIPAILLIAYQLIFTRKSK